MSDLPDVNEVLAAKGLEFQMGMDTDRKWATGVQVFPNPEATMLVFRDQNLMAGPDGQIQFAIKNVASVVMPTAVAREFHTILGQTLAAMDASVEQVNAKQ